MIKNYNHYLFMNQEYVKNISFKEWKELVQDKIFIRYSVLLDDLPDENYHVNYEDGMIVKEMVEIVVKNNWEYLVN